MSKKSKVQPKGKISPKKKAKSGRQPGSTKEEIRKRIDHTCQLLNGLSTSKEVIDLLVKKYDVTERMAENYISAAKDKMFEIITGRSKQEWYAKSFIFWQGILDSNKTTIEQKMKAQEKIDGLAGLRPSGGTHVSIVGQAITTTNNTQVNFQEESVIARLKKLPELELENLERSVASILVSEGDSTSQSGEDAS